MHLSSTSVSIFKEEATVAGVVKNYLKKLVLRYTVYWIWNQVTKAIYAQVHIVLNKVPWNNVLLKVKGTSLAVLIQRAVLGQGNESTEETLR